MTLFDYYFKSFVFTQDISYLVAVITGIKLFKYFDFRLKLIFVLLSVGLLANIISLTYVWISKKHNLFINNSYSILEFVLFSFFYINIFDKLFFKRVILFFLTIYILVVSYSIYKDIFFSISFEIIVSFSNILITCYVLCFLFIL